MRRRLLIPVVLGLLALTVASPVAGANPHERHTFSQSGLFADAYWDTCFPEVAETCTSVYISVLSGVRSDSSGVRPTRSAGDEVCYSSNIYDPTGGDPSFTYTYGCSTTATVTFADDLSTATASGTIEVQDCTFDPEVNAETCTPGGTVDVSATWTAIGPLEQFRERSRSTSTVEGMTCTNMFSGQGTRRFGSATATVDGVSLGDADFAFLSEGRQRSSFSCR